MSEDWNVYRTRFLVRARRLTQPVTFKDALGREHRGKPGDYLVQSSEGLLRVAQREIFEDVYVALSESVPAVFPASQNAPLLSPESLPMQGFVEKMALTGNSSS